MTEEEFKGMCDSFDHSRARVRGPRSRCGRCGGSFPSCHTSGRCEGASGRRDGAMGGICVGRHADAPSKLVGIDGRDGGDIPHRCPRIPFEEGDEA